MKGVYYIAANKYEGCGHHHKTITAAKRCAAVLSGWVLSYQLGGGEFHIYRMKHGVKGVKVS